MLRQRFSHVGRWEETDDVLQRAMLRLYKSLEAVTLESGRHFYNLAATQIRRELIELARHYYGPQGQGTRHETDQLSDGVGGRMIPKHERPDSSAEQLPPEVREVVELRWYQGLTPGEVAEVLDVDERTVRRRWVAAKTKLRNDFCGEPPSAE
jgi:RNA polymerase sigma-70 factor (ECF subfamily)